MIDTRADRADQPSEVAPAPAPAVEAAPAHSVEDSPRGPRPVGGWMDHAIGAGLALAYVVWLLATVRSLGFSRDEGFYFRAATDYARWFRLLFEHPAQAFEPAAIDSAWADNHEHPALMKSLFALSFLFLHEKHAVFADASTAFRFPAIVLAGVALWVTYLFGARVHSRRAGVTAAVLLGLMPNVFYHAHLACFDVPIMTMWLLAVYVYWRAHETRHLGWALAAGVVFGLTLETKHNAWELPAVFVIHAAVAERRAVLEQLRLGRILIPTTLVAMATLGPLVFYALWPWIWHDTFDRVQWYVNFHLHHDYYNIEFLHQNYYGPPSPKAYVPVMIVATVPLATLVLFGVGAFDRLAAYARHARARVALLRRSAPPAPDEHRPLSALPELVGAARKHLEPATELLLLLAFAVPLAPFFLDKTPIFGGTKHWLPSYPFLAMLAGSGFDLVARAMERTLSPRLGPRAMHAAKVGLFASVTVAPLAVTAHSHPFGLSAYTPVVGGTAGGADLGLCRQFWGFTTQSLAPYFERAAPPNASVFIHDTAWESWARMLDERRLRPDLRAVGSPAEADLSIVHHELHMEEVDVANWVTYGHDNPDYVLTHDGVPIISVYRKSP
jgi:4-amino-4-deoxy-L-arabinose transferase-like glycosyltransferase